MSFKVNLKASKDLTFQIEGGSQKEVFKAIAEVSEIFAEPCCGLCGGDELKHVVRTIKKFEYYELQCQNPECRGKLVFGQSQSFPGSLFPKRKLDENGKPDLEKGKHGKSRGWTTYKGEVE